MKIYHLVMDSKYSRVAGVVVLRLSFVGPTRLGLNCTHPLAIWPNIISSVSLTVPCVKW